MNGGIYPLLGNTMRKQRDLPVTIYRILLYLSRMKDAENEKRRLTRIERAVSIDRKELRVVLDKLMNAGLIDEIDTAKVGRGGHKIIAWNITEAGRIWRSDIGRYIQLCQRMEFYPEEFFYLPSDAF